MIHFRRQQLIIGVNKGIRIYNLITDVESEHHIDQGSTDQNRLVPRSWPGPRTEKIQNLGPGPNE